MKVAPSSSVVVLPRISRQLAALLEVIETRWFRNNLLAAYANARIATVTRMPVGFFIARALL
jgi:hypothetical protein